MRGVVLQSNYLPWKGYFDLINNVDLFVFYDDVQFTKNDWRNRNKVKTEKGSEWISIPCGADLKRLVCEVQPTNLDWQKSHWSKIKHYYSKAPYFNNYKDFFEDFYLAKRWNNLSELNQYLIKNISKQFLGIQTKFDDSRNYNLQNNRAERLVDLLLQLNVTTYLTGPSAKNYFSENNLKGTNIKLEWMNYNGYKPYHQFFPPFDHHVSIIDLLFHEGYNSKKLLLSHKNNE